MDVMKTAWLSTAIPGVGLILLIVTILSAIPLSCASLISERGSVKRYDWHIVRKFPHDTTAFTQGLVFHGGWLYESTGRRGQSEIRKVHLETGEIVRRRKMEDEYFGEGLTILNDRVIQLTLSSGKGFVYDRKTFETLRTFSIDGAGWGLTNDGKQLIMSDGSAILHFLDSETFRKVRQITVMGNGEPVSKLNELEMIGDKIFANVSTSDEILIIDPRSAEVTRRINLERLVNRVKNEHSVNILNGIAYDSHNDRIFITGKLWPNIYEIKLREQPDSVFSMNLRNGFNRKKARVTGVDAIRHSSIKLNNKEPQINLLPAVPWRSEKNVTY